MILAAALTLALLGPNDPAADTLQLVNQARAARGIPALRADPRLARAARGHSRDMVAHAYFEHSSPTRGGLRARVRRTGWMRPRPVWSLGEDLAWGTYELSTPAAVVNAWLQSPPHRRIMLGRGFEVVGIGVAPGTPGHGAGLTYTADFGS
jgi:uncharacterized protein YkwD